MSAYCVKCGKHLFDGPTHTTWQCRPACVLASDLTAAEARIVELEALVPEDMRMACAQACEFAEYVEGAAKGAMAERARHYLSLPYAQELSARLRKGEAAEAVADRLRGLLREALPYIEYSTARSWNGGDPCHDFKNRIDAELTGTPVADGGE